MLSRRLWRTFSTVREQMSFDMVIVGGGPAGLSCAIRAKQVNPSLNVCVLEKGNEIGSHILSGNVFEPRALDELLPDWRSMGSPVTVPVSDDRFFILPNGRVKIPVPSFLFPSELHNEGNYLISLGELCKWLASHAESLGVEVYPGFAVAGPVIDSSSNRVIGVRTADTGIAKDTSRKPGYSPGMDLLAKQVILAEGARGSVSEEVMDRYGLRSACLSPATYSLGLKEVWEVNPSKHKEGFVSHAVGYPITDLSVYSGSFVYHMKDNLVHLGLVVGLDYSNPYLSPYHSFQEFKRHRWVSDLLSGGKCVSYGARVLNVSGVQGLPKLTFPGGILVGCGAGFLNLPKIKGTHTAMKSGMIAGELAAEHIASSPHLVELPQFESAIRSSWVYDELLRVRNMKPAFKRGGMVGGLAYGGFLKFFRGKEPWTWTWSKKDWQSTKPAAAATQIHYPLADGKLTFDLLENLSRTGVKHESDQPSHLKVKPEWQSIVPQSVSKYAAPETRFCPARVYEYPDDGKQLHINAENCIHCKCCAIKTPHEFIKWTVPEGGGGPQYSGM